MNIVQSGDGAQTLYSPLLLRNTPFTGVQRTGHVDRFVQSGNFIQQPCTTGVNGYIQQHDGKQPWSDVSYKSRSPIGQPYRSDMSTVKQPQQQGQADWWEEMVKAKRFPLCGEGDWTYPPKQVQQNHLQPQHKEEEIKATRVPLCGVRDWTIPRLQDCMQCEELSSRVIQLTKQKQLLEHQLEQTHLQLLNIKEQYQSQLAQQKQLQQHQLKPQQTFQQLQFACNREQATSGSSLAAEGKTVRECRESSHLEPDVLLVKFRMQLSMQNLEEGSESLDLSGSAAFCFDRIETTSSSLLWRRALNLPTEPN